MGHPSAAMHSRKRAEMKEYDGIFRGKKSGRKIIIFRDEILFSKNFSIFFGFFVEKNVGFSDFLKNIRVSDFLKKISFRIFFI